MKKRTLRLGGMVAAFMLTPVMGACTGWQQQALTGPRDVVVMTNERAPNPTKDASYTKDPTDAKDHEVRNEVLARRPDLLPGARARVFINVLPLLATMHPAYPSAQVPLSLGERIRIHMADGRMMSGTLVSWSGERVSVSVPEYAMRSVIGTMGQPNFTTLEKVKSRVVCKSERKLLDASVRLPWRPPWARGVRGPGNGARSRPQ